MACKESATFALKTMVSRRDNASRGLLACKVVSEPSWPVFIAANISSASTLLTSPTTIRSGRILNAFLTKSRIVTAPCPSEFAVRASSVTTCGCWIDNSAESSIVTILCRGSTKPAKILSKVVLPEPVPPETRIFKRRSTHNRKKSASEAGKVCCATRSCISKRFLGNFRMVRLAPLTEIGGKTAFSREPSGKRASTIGEASSILRPSGYTMRSITLRTACSSLNCNECLRNVPLTST